MDQAPFSSRSLYWLPLLPQGYGPILSGRKRGSETAQHCHVFFLFFSIYQLQTSSLTNHTDVVNRQTPFSPLRNHSPFLSLPFSDTPSLRHKIVGTHFVSLICLVGTENYKSGILAIAREMLIVPVWVCKLETCGTERTLED